MKKTKEGIYGRVCLNKQKYLDEFKKLYAEGLDDTEISKKLDVNYTTIRNWRIKLNLPTNFKYKRKFDTSKFKELYDKGLTYAQIAKELKVSDSAIQNYASSLNLKSNYLQYDNIVFSDEEYQILLGTMLGDGWLRIPFDSKNATGGFAHSLKQQNYCVWKYEKLQRFCTEPVFRSEYDKRTKKTYHNIYVHIKVHPIITELYNKLYHPKKYINKELINSLSPLGIAVWFMDDGYYDHGGYGIATNCFSQEDLQNILNMFKLKFNLDFTIYSNNSIRVGVKNNQAENFLNLIKPYIHKDCIYKLHEDPH